MLACAPQVGRDTVIEYTKVWASSGQPATAAYHGKLLERDPCSPRHGTVVDLAEDLVRRAPFNGSTFTTASPG